MRIIVFVCNWCSYGGADTAGSNRLKYNENIRLIRVMCSGRVDPQFVLDAFREGADGVMILGCHPGDCHYQNGNMKALRRARMMSRMLSEMGIEKERFVLEWVSASEGQRFADVVNQTYENIKKLGPLNLKRAETGNIESAPEIKAAPEIEVVPEIKYTTPEIVTPRPSKRFQLKPILYFLTTALITFLILTGLYYSGWQILKKQILDGYTPGLPVYKEAGPALQKYAAAIYQQQLKLFSCEDTKSYKNLVTRIKSDEKYFIAILTDVDDYVVQNNKQVPDSADIRNGFDKIRLDDKTQSLASSIATKKEKASDYGFAPEDLINKMNGQFSDLYNQNHKNYKKQLLLLKKGLRTLSSLNNDFFSTSNAKTVSAAEPAINDNINTIKATMDEIIIIQNDNKTAPIISGMKTNADKYRSLMLSTLPLEKSNIYEYKKSLLVSSRQAVSGLQKKESSLKKMIINAEKLNQALLSINKEKINNTRNKLSLYKKIVLLSYPLVYCLLLVLTVLLIRKTNGKT